MRESMPTYLAGRAAGPRASLQPSEQRPRTASARAAGVAAFRDCINGTLTLSCPDRLIAKHVNISSVCMCVCVCVTFCNFRGCFYQRLGQAGGGSGFLVARWIHSSYFITLSLSLGPCKWPKYNYFFL